jgi:protease-4
MDNTIPPPFPTPPPVISPPSPARARPAGRGWKILALLLLAVLGLVVINAVFQAARRGATKARTARLDGRWLEEVVIENNHSANKIAVIEIAGIITGEALDWTGQGMVEFIRDQLELAGEDEAVKAVLLKINSPGGEVLASDEIYQAIKEFQEQHDKPN